ncbi:MAG: N-acetylmuramoyl-L-alanine amidase [Solirubrobacterales bacterium]
MRAASLAILALAVVVGGSLAATNTERAALDAKTIVLDPGHNGGNAANPKKINKKVPAGGFRKECDTTGTTTSDGKLSEHAFNWDMARRLKKLLEARGAKVVLTRKNDRGVGPCIDRRAAIGNRAKADAVLSIHADGGPASGRGFHLIHPGKVSGYTEPIVKPSKRLALDMRTELIRAGMARANYIGKNGLSQRTDLGGLNLSKVPKVFVELGNMRNRADAKRLKSRSWRQATARALRDGLARYVARD